MCGGRGQRQIVANVLDEALVIAGNTGKIVTAVNGELKLLPGKANGFAQGVASAESLNIGVLIVQPVLPGSAGVDRKRAVLGGDVLCS